jgi:tol-pal system protein YbgF
MVGRTNPTEMLQGMIRSAYLLALACTLWASAAHAQASDADLVTRIDHLQAEIRDLTGTVEQLQYRNQQLEQEVQRLTAGAPAATPPRPTAETSPPPSSQYTGIPQYSPAPPAQYSPPPAPVIAAAPAAAPPPDSDASSGGHGDAFNPALNPNAPGAPRPLGTSTTATEPPPPVSDAPIAAPAQRQPGAPLDLSSVSAPAGAAPPGGGAPGAELPPPPPVNPSGTGATQAALPPSNTPKDDYDLAYGYVLQKQYGPAADAFRDFLQKYPSDRLAGEAQYWLGESLYQSQQYHDAAEAFLAVSTKYETTARAPDALLRLGQSLAALGEKEAACASLGEVLRKYPKASPSVKQTVDREQKRVHC